MTKPHFADGRYLTQEIIGSGGMALVVKVFDQNLNIERAIKMLPATVQHSPEARLRHEREAQLAAQLDHPHVVPIHDFFEDEGQLCTVMSLAKGNVVDWVQAHGLVSPHLAIQEMLGVLDALDKAHALGIVHRDIKPHNILLSEDGRLQLADFGIAQFKDPVDSLTHTGALLGSLAFMAPEQRQDSTNVDSRCDLYAVAGTLIWMLLCKTPLDLQLAEDRPALLSEIPESLRAVLTRATDEDPENRYKDASSLSKALKEELQKLPPAKTDFKGFIKEAGFGALKTIPPPIQSAAFTTQSISQNTGFQPRDKNAVYGLIFVLSCVIAFLGYLLLQPHETQRPASTTQPKTKLSAYDLPPCHDAINFNTRPLRKLGGRETLGSALVDIDQDGFLDAVFVQQMDENINIYWGNEAGELDDAISFSIERTGAVPAVGDVNGDKLQDLVFVSADKAKISIFLATSPREFKLHQHLFQDQHPIDPVLLHLNRDNKLDLAFLGVEGLSWRPGDGKGGFGEHRLLTPPLGAFSFAKDRPSKVLFSVTNNELSTYELRGELFAESPKVLVSLPEPETAASPYDRHQVRAISTKGKTELLVWEYPRAEWIIKYREAENWAGCLYTRFERQRIGGIGDWSKDGILDLISHRTCSYCTSNQELRLGQ